MYWFSYFTKINVNSPGGKYNNYYFELGQDNYNLENSKNDNRERKNSNYEKDKDGRIPANQLEKEQASTLKIKLTYVKRTVVKPKITTLKVENEKTRKLSVI